MWVMLGEMFPNQIRGSGLAVAGLFSMGRNLRFDDFPHYADWHWIRAWPTPFMQFFAALSVCFCAKYITKRKTRA